MYHHDRLEKLFAEGFRALDIANPLPSFDHGQAAAAVRGILLTTGTRAAGVRTAGLVNGYVLVDDLTDGSCGDHLRPFAQGQIVSEDAGLRQAISVLADYEQCFVATLGTVDAVIGRGDMDKPAARMWLFGVITIIETNMGQMVEFRWPNESWLELLSKGRQAKAQELFRERRRRGQHVRLIDCLQLGDKATLLLRDAEFVAEAGFSSTREAKQLIKDVGTLRNAVAHSQTFSEDDWAAIPILASRLERVLARARMRPEDQSRGDRIVDHAKHFAVDAHGRIDHRRKYTNDPYAVHLQTVAAMVAEVTDDAEVIAAAWLHDVVEDTQVGLAEIERAFGARVAALVDDLTDVSRPVDGNRVRRKARDREHSAAASAEAKTIKLADLIDNVRSIVARDPRFARVYVEEKEQLLPLLSEGDRRLFERASQLLKQSRERLV